MLLSSNDMTSLVMESEAQIVPALNIQSSDYNQIWDTFDLSLLESPGQLYQELQIKQEFDHSFKSIGDIKKEIASSPLSLYDDAFTVPGIVLKQDLGGYSPLSLYDEQLTLPTINQLEVTSIKKESPQPDHTLLRQALKDTSFQKRYNLIEVSLGDLGTGFRAMDTSGGNNGGTGTSEEPLTGDDIEPALSMAMEQFKKDIHSTCAVLGINREPNKWTNEEVGTWLAWNCAQYNLPSNIVEKFTMNGYDLTSLSEQEFQQKDNQHGSLLHAQLEIWKAANIEDTKSIGSPLTHDSNTLSSSSCGDPSEDEDEDESMGDGSSTSTSRPASGSGRAPGSHIHLWQFLKELLANPQLHGSCIRWVDRSQGVFKIEDSVRVAKLWGKRKNRPAMNYDKLSRSIRQYYKKGIMKKTERSQRLVYQFCHPYSL